MYRACMAVSPEAASTIALLCSLPVEHTDEHVAANSARVLAVWREDGVVILHYDHQTERTTRP